MESDFSELLWLQFAVPPLYHYLFVSFISSYR